MEVAEGTTLVPEVTPSKKRPRETGMYYNSCHTHRNVYSFSQAEAKTQVTLSRDQLLTMSSKEIEDYVCDLKSKRSLTAAEEKDLKRQRRYASSLFPFSLSTTNINHCAGWSRTVNMLPNLALVRSSLWMILRSSLRWPKPRPRNTRSRTKPSLRRTRSSRSSWAASLIPSRRCNRMEPSRTDQQPNPTSLHLLAMLECLTSLSKWVLVVQTTRARVSLLACWPFSLWSSHLLPFGTMTLSLVARKGNYYSILFCS